MDEYAKFRARLQAAADDLQRQMDEEQRIEDEKAIEMAEFRSQAGGPHVSRRGAAFGPEPRGRIESPEAEEELIKEAEGRAQRWRIENELGDPDTTYEDAISGARPNYRPSPDMAAIIESVRKGRATQSARRMRPRDDINSILSKLMAEGNDVNQALSREVMGDEEIHPDQSIHTGPNKYLRGGIVRDNPFDSPAGLTREELDLLEGWSQLDNQARDLESRIDLGPGRGTTEGQDKQAFTNRLAPLAPKSPRVRRG
jgi:hypothetical protein